MKSVFWKITAVASIILGSLGPQVAQGYLATDLMDSAVEQSGPTLEVVSSNLDTVITMSSGPDCTSGNLSFDRFDLLLWHNCNFQISLGTVMAPKVTVATKLPELPQVVVLRPESNQLPNHAEFWNSHSQPTAAFIANSVIKLSALSETSSPQNLQQPTFSEDLLITTDSSQKYIVMRC